MKTIITLVMTIGVAFAGYPISIPFTNDTTHRVAYNLIDTDPSCYHRGFCPNFYPGGKLSTFPNSEEKYQHILHNMFRVFTNQSINQSISLSIKYGKWINGSDKSGGRTYFFQQGPYCGNSYANRKPLYWYSDSNQAARFKQWDYNTCNKYWYSQVGNTDHLTCMYGKGIINNVPSNRCKLFGTKIGTLNDCQFGSRAMGAFCQEDRCWFETESLCSGNECLVGIECNFIFASKYDYLGVGFIQGYNKFTTVYSRFTREISYLLPVGVHFDERTKIVEDDYNEEGKHFTLWLEYYDVNNTQTVENCYSLYDNSFHIMNLLVGNRGSNGGEFYSAMFTSNHLPPLQCEPYAFICKTSLGNYFRLPQDKHYYFGTEWMDGNNSNHANFGLECKENHYFFDDNQSEWIVNGGPTLNKSDIWYYKDTINYGKCIGCNHIHALQCWSQCIIHDFSDEFCAVCMNVTTTDTTEMPTKLPTTDPTAFPTQMPTLIRTTIVPTNSPLTCPDYAYNEATNLYGEYPPIYGPDYDIMTQKTQVILGPKYENITGDETAIFFQLIKTCDNNDGCNFKCSEIAACYQSQFICNSLTGCNVMCTNGFSCGQLNFYAMNTGSNGKQIHIECYKDSCQEMEIFIDGIDSAHIHCKEEDACTDMIVHFNNITSRNNHNTSVTCYVENACTNLKILADGKLSKLHMYAYSDNIILNNGYGLSLNEDTITCDLHTKFVQYEYAQASHNYLAQLIKNKQGKLPCQGINITCNNNSTASCIMTYVFTDPLIFDSLPGLSDTKFFETHCVRIALYDMVRLQCQGNCKVSNTLSPTMAPSSAPTNIPIVSNGYKIQCNNFKDCDWNDGYRCVSDPVCLGNKGYLLCRNKKVCLNTYGICTSNEDCDGDHKCAFRGESPYGVCIQYQ